jgi:signal transduction histidine kinase
MDANHPGMMESLNGESGINYFQSSEGEHVVAFTSVRPIGWGLIIEEAWHDIANPTLVNTQAAPLVIVPIFLLALAAIWFGVRSIVAPLQKLEKQAASLAQGNFEAIHQPVGGIAEIHNLQSELIEMADQLGAAQQSLHSYIGSITAGVENERRSLARELHDDTIQALIALNQRVQLLLMETPEKKRTQLKELQALVEQSILHLRRTIRGLRPIYLEEFGLMASLDMLIKELRDTTAIVLSFEAGGEECRFESQRELALYRMVQESLSNVIRHSGASHAWVTLNFMEKECTIRIRDDGHGFRVPNNPAESSRQGHFGLLGQYERAELIGAALSIQSSPGSGTIVKIRLPLDRPAEPAETRYPEEGSHGSE